MVCRVCSQSSPRLCHPEDEGITVLQGDWGGIVVKALRYYLDGPGINSQRCHWIFQ